MLENRSTDPLFTYGDYVLWQGDERWELIDGEPYLMSPAPTVAHQRVVLQLGAQLVAHLSSKPCEALVAAIDVRLPNLDQSDKTILDVVQPDLIVVCDPEKLDEAGCRGAPAWIIEVLSPATLVRDQVHKRDLYERHGVGEYWIVHPTEKTLIAYQLDTTTGKFGPAVTKPAQSTLKPVTFPDLEIDGAPVFEH